MKRKQFSMAEFANEMGETILKQNSSNKKKIVAMLVVLAVEFGNFIDLYAENMRIQLKNNEEDE